MMKRILTALVVLMNLNQYIAASEFDYLDKSGDGFHRELAALISKGKTNASPEFYLEQIKTRVLSDRVGFYFNIEAAMEGGTLLLKGDCERPEFKNIAHGVLKYLGFSKIVDSVQVLPDLSQNPDPFGVVIVPSLLTHSQPDFSGLPMDEALFGQPVYVLKETNGVALIKTITGYWGFGPAKDLRRVSRSEFLQCVNGNKVLLQRDVHLDGLFLPSGTKLLLQTWGEGDKCQILNPKGGTIELQKAIASEFCARPILPGCLPPPNLFSTPPIISAVETPRPASIAPV